MDQPNWKMFILPIVVLFVFIGGIIGIINWQKSKDTAFPTIQVNIDEKGAKVKEKNFTITGSTEKKNKLWINTDETTVDKDGSFSSSVILNPGKNVFSMKAENTSGKTTVLERTLTLVAPANAKTPSRQKAVYTDPSTSVITGQNLSASGPEDAILPVLGFGGIVIAVVAYMKSRKQLVASMRK